MTLPIFLLTLLTFILVLSVLVFVHELGHFLAAKKAGILVEEFGFGLPPKIWGKKIGETVYSINALPIGGFVKLFGEDGGESENGKYDVSREVGMGRGENKGRAFFEKSLFQRLSVLLAGVTMNFFLAIVAFSVFYYIVGIPVKTGKVMIVGIVKDSPAATSSLKIEDQIVGVDGEAVVSIDGFIKRTAEKTGKKVTLEIKRGEENMSVSLLAREKPPQGEGPLGVAVSEVELKKFPWWQTPYLGVREGLKDSFSWGKMVLVALKQTFGSLLAGRIPREVAGPIGIFQITGQVVQGGYLAVLQFLGILSINLMIMNALPFPAFDGGRVVFLGYEAIFRKKVPAKTEALINQVGLMILLSLMALISVNDILRIVRR